MWERRKEEFTTEGMKQPSGGAPVDFTTPIAKKLKEVLPKSFTSLAATLERLQLASSW